MLTDIRALADHSLMALPNINTDTRARPVSGSGGKGAGRAAGPRPKSGHGRGGVVAAHAGNAEGGESVGWVGLQAGLG